MQGIAGQTVAVGNQGEGDNYFAVFVCCGQVVCAEWRGARNKNADKNNVRKIARPSIKNIGIRLQFHQDGTECSS